MKILELFCGTKSFSKVAKERGHQTFTIDNNPNFNSDLTYDLINALSNKTIMKEIMKAEVIWMSPPCTTFSMASGNTHWNKERQPKTIQAKFGKKLLEVCWAIAVICKNENKLFFIENPRARARWFLPKEYRKTAWYCQYGDSRAKPTDIWTNLEDWNPNTCRNGNKNCHHESAPRGSKTGTQGLKGSKDRSIVPKKLCLEIIKSCEKNTTLTLSQ